MGRSTWSAVLIPRFELRLLPLAVLVIVAATAIPIELRTPRGLEQDFNLFDVLQNLVLFVPLGIALCRRPLHQVLAIALALSGCVESLQIWQFQRFPSLFDVAANATGALAAAWLTRDRWGSDEPSIRVTSAVLTGSVVLAAALLVFWQLPTRSAAIAGWDENYLLLVGDEAGGGRLWRGSVAEIFIWNRALSEEELRALANHDARLTSDAIFVAADVLPASAGAPRRFPRDVTARVASAVERSGAMTVAARVNPENLEQNGPARIVSFSRDTQFRNFDLGQERDSLSFRVRTAVSGPNGEDARAQTLGGLKAGSFQFIAATYDGAIARIYIDGEPHGRRNIAAAGCRVPGLCDSGLPLAWAWLGVVSAMLTCAAFRTAPRLRRVACLAAGTILPAVNAAVGFMPENIESKAWVPVTAVLGALAVALAFKPLGERHQVSVSAV